MVDFTITIYADLLSKIGSRKIKVSLFCQKTKPNLWAGFVFFFD
jgi:hypothetical protein